MARKKSLMSWLISKIDPGAKAETLLEWVADTVAPVSRDKYGRQALAKQRQRIKKQRKPISDERAATRQTPDKTPTVSRETPSGRDMRAMGDRELQLIWMSPWEDDAVKEAALEEWLRIWPHPDDAGLGPAEFQAFREIYDGKELW